MTATGNHEPICAELSALQPDDPRYAVQFVDALLAEARRRGASDVHLLPTPGGLDIRWRLDGVLHCLGLFPAGQAADIVTRLKVLAGLLTYRADVPQEGRIRGPTGTDMHASEMRVSTLPSLYGEKAVVRLFSAPGRFQRLADLGLPAEILEQLRQLLGETAGAILVTGPAGGGKTTTLYACLRELLAQSAGGRSIVTLEDPVEVALPGITQSQVNPAAGFDLAAGLRSVVRQDPEVIMVGEIRDRATAEVALQASLTGQLVLSSFHAGSSAAAISRLTDMGIEPYVLQSGIVGIISQRLVRRLCACSRPAAGPGEWLGLEVREARIAVGCPECAGTGYVGRLVLAELLRPQAGTLHEAILSRSKVSTIARLAHEAGMVSLLERATAAVEAGLTSPAEVRRVCGFQQNGFAGD